MSARYVLGRYVEWVVPTSVEHVVQASWTYAPGRGHARASDPAVHRVIPHTGVSLVVYGRCDGRGAFRAHGLQLQGACTTPRFFRPSRETALVAVRLRPEWVRTVLAIDAAEAKDRIIDLTGEVGWRETLVRLGRHDRVPEVRAALEGFVHDRLGEVHSDANGIAAHRALERLRRDPGRKRVAGVAAATGVSERTLRRRVTTLTGMSPKWIQRVERLTSVVTAADGARRPVWSALAQRHGFADQAHLVREARAITGCTPAGLHDERRRQHRSSFAVARPGA